MDDIEALEDAHADALEEFQEAEVEYDDARDAYDQAEMRFLNAKLVLAETIRALDGVED